MSLSTTPRTWVSGEVVTAAEMNTEIRDAFVGVQAAWTAYTPPLTNITLGNGSLAGCKFAQLGKTIIGRIKFTAGTTTTYAAGNLTFGPPVLPSADYTGGASVAVGDAAISPAGTITAAVVRIVSGGMIFTNASGGTVTNASPAAMGTTSTIAASYTYEAA